jgi:hypothetical protein
MNRPHSDSEPDLGALIHDPNGSAPLRPMWPYVQSRLQQGRRSGWSVAFGSGALATAGFALGLLLGQGAEMQGGAEEELWSSLGSSFAEGSSFTLDAVYEHLDGEDGS